MILLPIEGVLAQRSTSLKGQPPTAEGKALYSLLINSGEPVVLVSAEREPQVAQDWLALEGFLRFAEVYHRGADPGSYEQFKVATLRRALATGHRVRFYVDSDPAVITQVSDIGVPALLVVVPGDAIGRRISRDQQSYQPWDTLVDTIETRAQEKANLSVRQLDVQEA
jgi:hypothetical protein